MLREDAADSEAVAVHIFPICAAIRKLGRITRAIRWQCYLCRHVAIRVRGSPCMRENRFSGTRGQIGGGGALAGGRGVGWWAGPVAPALASHYFALIL